MEAIRLLHLADIHIGVENYGRLDASTGLHTRLQDFSRCLEYTVDTALDWDVDLVLFAGDAYKHASPTPTHEGKLAEQFKRFADAEIPVVMVTGNHDIPAAFGKHSALTIFQTLGGEHYFHVAEKPMLKRLTTRRGPVQVACFPWPTRHILLTKDEYKSLSNDEVIRTIEEKCERRIQKFTRDVDPDIPAVLLAHVAVAGAGYSGSERNTTIGHDPMILQGILKNPVFDYVALGHIHRHQDLNRGQFPPVVYPGSLERIDFGEAGEEKGFCLVSLQKGAAEYEFIHTPARRFVNIEEDLREHVFPTQRLLDRIKTFDIHNAVVRVTCTVSESQQHDLNLPQIRAALDGAFLVAGIHRTTEDTRSQRPRISDDASLSDALSQYIEMRPELQGLKKDLQEYAGRLIQELEDAE
ncbi:exonuclease sbcCD subunit D [candidate division KSB3 bacterium]|uniref:Nuclease SbcCD subunit D n=1 Tax=candidate division KSB3 bacterium TaxID=2044937 RepID=A0A2G6E2W7_9BACT|nr:MAG: exonuclease sbcCD subunit D [candidate division KSB3 bacterium]PIE28785.1 MAG: exonuclease sbcCD subunit D [candidate division KSB3 bacterium]